MRTVTILIFLMSIASCKSSLNSETTSSPLQSQVNPGPATSAAIKWDPAQMDVAGCKMFRQRSKTSVFYRNFDADAIRRDFWDSVGYVETTCLDRPTRWGDEQRLNMVDHKEIKFECYDLVNRGDIQLSLDRIGQINGERRAIFSVIEADLSDSPAGICVHSTLEQATAIFRDQNKGKTFRHLDLISPKQSNLLEGCFQLSHASLVEGANHDPECELQPGSLTIPD